MKAILDFIPLVLFFYFAKTQGIMQGSKVLLITSVIVYGGLFVMQKFKLEKHQWLVLVLTIVMCGLTLVLHDDMWLRWKSPIINIVFGLVFLLGSNIAPLFNLDNTPLAKRLLHTVFELSEQRWKRLNLAWAVFFFVMAGLHTLFAFVFKDYWLDFKVFGGLLLTIMFIISQFFVLRYDLKPIKDAKKQ